MELKAGYRKTEVGVIPADWLLVELRDCLAIKSGLAFSSAHFSDKGPILLTPGNFKLSGGLIFIERNTKRYGGMYPASAVFEHGDLLIVMTDLTPDCNLLGKPALVDRHEPILHNQRIGKIQLSSKKVSKAFLYWYFLSDAHAARMKNTATGSTVRHTSNKSIYESKIALPPTDAEQQAIADALSDTDALIESLDQLIAKKRQIKQGAMQELLTGKRRLPGFVRKWELRALGEIAPLQRGFDLPNSRLKPGSYPVVASNGVLNHHSTFQVKGPGVVTGRSGTIGVVTFVEENFWPHNTSLWVTSFRANEPKFVFYLYARIGLERFSTGSGVPTLNRNDVHAFKVEIPVDKDEQAAIATVLSDMDTELAALESRLAKARQIKQGMMQELLTGRIRLL